MATYENIETLGFEAGEDLTAAQYLAVVVDSLGQVVKSGAGGAAVGILLNSPSDNAAAVVATGGKTKVIAGGTVAAGARVASDAAGKIVTAVAGDYVLGTAATGGAANEVIEVVYNPNGIEPA